MVQSTSQPSMTYTPAFYQNRDKGIGNSSHQTSVEKQTQETGPLPAPQAVLPVSHLTEKYHVFGDSFKQEPNPHSPLSTASYSRNASLVDQPPVQVPSPTYSQSSRAEQGYHGRDVNSRSGMMVDEYGRTSMPSVARNSPDYIFTRHEDAESVDETTSNHAVWLLVRSYPNLTLRYTDISVPVLAVMPPTVIFPLLCAV